MTDHEKLMSDPEFWRRQADQEDAIAQRLYGEADEHQHSAERHRIKAEELERGKP